MSQLVKLRRYSDDELDEDLAAWLPWPKPTSMAGYLWGRSLCRVSPTRSHSMGGILVVGLGSRGDANLADHLFARGCCQEVGHHGNLPA